MINSPGFEVRAAAAVGLMLVALTSLCSGLAAQSQPPPASAEAGFVLGLPAATPLDGKALDAATHEVASDIRCPVCQGLSIADSPVDIAIAMRAEVREMLANGYSDDQVFDYFEASYGEFIRLEPKAEGFNLVVWIAPVLGLLIGLGIVGRRLSQGRASTSAPSREEGEGDIDTPLAEDDDDLAEYLAQVRREVGS